MAKINNQEFFFYICEKCIQENKETWITLHFKKPIATLKIIKCYPHTYFFFGFFNNDFFKDLDFLLYNFYYLLSFVLSYYLKKKTTNTIKLAKINMKVVYLS